MINDKLNTLIILAKEKSYTKTAEICNISQPAVTQHIKSLEDLYQIKIFKRKGKELLITNEGSILIRNAKRLIALNSNIEKEINFSLTKTKKLDIGVTRTASTYFIPEILSEFKTSFPDLHYNFHTDIAENIYDRLKYLELDFAIIDGIPNINRFEYKLLATDELIFIAPKNHPLTLVEEVTFEMLKKEKFILREKKANTRFAFENYLNNHFETIKSFNVILETDNTALIKQLIIDGYGIGLSSRAICETNLRIGTLQEIKVKDFVLKRGIYLVYRKEMKNDEVIKSIINLVH